MPLFFFDIHDGDLITDDIGVECENFDAVRREAKRSLPEMARDVLPEDGELHTIRVIVRNERDKIVYTGTLTFSGQATEGNDEP